MPSGFLHLNNASDNGLPILLSLEHIAFVHQQHQDAPKGGSIIGLSGGNQFAVTQDIGQIIDIIRQLTAAPIPPRSERVL
jgi:hypothetical protein